jgi:hypothetical protein
MLNKLTAAIFVCALAAPLAAWLALGAPARYGNRELAVFPKIGEIFSHRSSGRKRLADAVLERSPLRRWAIAELNRIAYHGFGAIETSTIVSGRDRWLFFKESFWGGKCQPDAYFLKGLNAAAIMTGLAKAAGFKLVVSVSPDKSSVYPEMLERGAIHASACKAENGARWRRLARERGSGVLDHAPTLLEHKQPGRNLYFVTDTHWTPLARALAVRELAAAYYGLAAANAPQPRLWGKGRLSDTDMGHRMLLLDVDEKFDRTDFGAAAYYFVRNGNSALRRRLVVFHDSFYEAAKRFLAQAFPGLTMVTLNQSQEVLAAKASAAGAIIYNSVERSFFIRAPRHMAADGFLGRTVLARNRLAARGCRDLPRFAAPVLKDGGGAGESVTLRLPQAAAKGRFCLRVETTGGAAGAVEISLGNEELPFRLEPGRSFAAPVGAGAVALALPAAWGGRILRVAPGDGGLRVKDVAVFGFPPDRTASVDRADRRNFPKK